MIKATNPQIDGLTKSTNHGKVVAADSTKVGAVHQVDGQVLTAKSAGKVNAARFERWANLGEVQQKYAQAKSAERSLLAVYRELATISRSIKATVKNPQQVSDNLAQLQRSVSEDLSHGLRPKVLSNQPQQSQFVLNAVDLFSVKPAETINLAVPAAGKAVSFHLPQGAKSTEVVDIVAKALTPLNIDVKANAEQKLVLSIDSKHSNRLAEPVLFSGEGVRVPAGNPVPVQLQEQPHELAQLSTMIEQDNADQVSAKIANLQNEVKRSIATLRYIMSKIQQNSTPISTTTNIGQVESELGDLLRQGDFGSRLTGLLAQANISRDTAVSLLKSRFTAS